MATSYKATASMKLLKDILVKRLPSTYVFTETVDASLHPVLTIAQDASWATADQYAVIRIKPEEPLAEALDALGLAQRKFSPTIVQVCVEETAVGGNSFLSAANQAKIMVEVFKLGMKVEIYLSNTTEVPTTTQMTAANLFASVYPDLYNPLTNQI